MNSVSAISGSGHSPRTFNTYVFTIAAASCLAFISPFVNHTSWTGWSFTLIAYAGTVFLLWQHHDAFQKWILRFMDRAHDWEMERQTWERDLNQCKQAYRDSKQGFEARIHSLEDRNSQLTLRLEEEQKRNGELQESLKKVQEDLEELHRQNEQLSNDRSEAIAKRQSLQNQYIELEQSSKELKSVHAERAEQHRRSVSELAELRSDFQKIHLEREEAKREVARLKAEIENFKMAQSNAELRETKLNSQLADWKAKLQEAETENRKLKANRALNEELASRKNEIERLAHEVDALTKQRSLAVEKNSLLEEEKQELVQQLSNRQAEISSMNNVISDLQDECRTSRLEPRQEMAKHFVWRLNFFQENEVLLNFVNQGVTLDLIQAWTQPDLTCEVPKERCLQRGKEGTIRISAGKLPSEFLLNLRYTIHPQQATLKIRPYDSIKIERV